MRPFRHLLFSASLAVVLAATTQAQPPGGGGRGGFGGTPVTQLLQSKTVREELKLTEEQTSKLKEWGTEFQTKMREKRDGIPREEMREKLPAIMAEMQKTVWKDLGEVLKPEQVKRLKQVEFQVSGLRALGNPETAAALKVTDDQKEKLKSVLDDSGKEMRDLSEEYGGRFPGQRPTDPDKAKEFDKKSAKISKDATAKAMEVMTAEQKKQYAEMAGDPIDVTKVRSETTSGFTGKKKQKDDN